MPKVSVIIPIYNVDKYLNQTLSSVENQTLRDIEIICVNDCSPDNSKAIIQSFVEKDTRFKLIDLPENRGTGIARKKGILASSGDYIMFLDGDDYLTPDACEKAYSEISKDNLDIVQFDINIIPSFSHPDAGTDAEIKWFADFSKPYEGTLRYTKSGEMIRAYLELKLFNSWALYCKIFNGDIVRKAAEYFKEERFNLSEDFYLIYLICMFSYNYGSINDKLYCYRLGAGITGGKRMTDKRIEWFIEQGLILRYLTEFSAQFDSEGITAKSLENAKIMFIQNITEGWAQMKGTADYKTQIPLALEYFDKETFLAYAMQYYYSCDYNQKCALINGFKQCGLFEAAPKKIKTVATFYYRVYNGGIERVMSKLIPLWQEMGYRVILLTDEPACEKDYYYGDDVVRVVLPQVKKNEPEEYRRRITALEDALKQYDVDLMVYHAWFYVGLETDLLTVKSLHIPFVCYTHEFFASEISLPNSYLATRTLIIQKVYTIVDGVICLSNTDYNWWSMIHPRVYKTLNTSTFNIADVSPNTENESFEYDILWVGRISKEKQPFEALKILRSVMDSGVNAKLHIVGGGIFGIRAGCCYE